MASIETSLFATDDSDDKKNKSPHALRTISEASEALDVPQHVLRFWETKFPQIKPLKRNGGRRFYRPQDLDVLQQIKHLLYQQGYTIKGAKKAVDDFIHARAAGDVASNSEWIASIPPANSNDNLLPEAIGLQGDDVLAELAAALRDQEDASELLKTPAFPKEELLALRTEIAKARDILKLRMLAVAA